MSYFHPYFDHYLCGFFEDSLKSNYHLYCPEYKIPFNQKIKFTDRSRIVMELFHYPFDYRHLSSNEIRYYFWGYINLWGLFLYWKIAKNLRYQNPIFVGFWTILVTPIYSASTYALDRIKDVKSIHLVNGKTLLISTFQDNNDTLEFDLAELRVVNEDFDTNVVLVDRRQILKKRPVFYFIRRREECIFNKHMFEKIIIEQNYLKYI